MGDFIPLSVPNLCGRELEYITRAVKDQWVSTGGSFITDFEKAVAAYVGTAGAVACQSGTAGLHLALVACGVGPGDEVIVPTLTFIASVNPVRYVGAYPVFMDCDDTLTMDPQKVEDFCSKCCHIENGKLYNNKTNRPVTAILCVHVFGNLADMEALASIAQRYHLKLIEDACEALGSRWETGELVGKMAGTVSNIGVYSFNGNKIITTGGGGMIVSHDPELLSCCKHLSTQAKVDTVYFIHDAVGYNYRLTNLQAAMGLAQLELLEGFIAGKKERYEAYIREGFSLLPFRPGTRPNYWFYAYVTDRRDECIRYLDKHDIQTRPIWALLHTQEPYHDMETYRIEKAYDYYKRIVNIPCSTNLSDGEFDRVCSVLHSFEDMRGGRNP